MIIYHFERDSRTIEQVRAKGLKRYVKPELQYHSLQLRSVVCRSGGRVQLFTEGSAETEEWSFGAHTTASTSTSIP